MVNKNQIKYLEGLDMVECVTLANIEIARVLLDKKSNGMWFKDMLRNKDLEVIDSSNSKPIYYVELK